MDFFPDTFSKEVVSEKTSKRKATNDEENEFTNDFLETLNDICTNFDDFEKIN